MVAARSVSPFSSAPRNERRDGDPEQMGELLRGNLPPAVASAIDWAALRRLDGTFVDAQLKERHADLLFEARIGDEPLLLFVLVEHKSCDDRFTALQLLRYVVRIWDSWLAAHPKASALPPVLPFVVHHGSEPWDAPRSVRTLVGLDGVSADIATFVRALQPDMTFLLDDLAAATEEELASRMLSVVVDLTLRFLQFLRQRGSVDGAEDIIRWQHLVRCLLDHPRGQDVLAALVYWSSEVVPNGEQMWRTAMARIEDSKTRQAMKTGLDELLELGFAKGLEQGLEQGIERGVLQGQREIVRRQLATRFGSLPDDLEARLASASADDLVAWATRILMARSLAEVFQPR